MLFPLFAREREGERERERERETVCVFVFPTFQYGIFLIIVVEGIINFLLTVTT